MKKPELIEQVVKSLGTGLSKKDAESILDTAFQVIGQAICKEKRFAFPGFGTFTVRERPARKGRNPRTGEQITVKASRSVGFKPAPALKEGL